MKFEVYRKGRIATDFTLSGAYLFGIDKIPLRSSNKIRFKDGVIECKKKSNDSAGLKLLWPVEGFGKVLLPTTRLPDRKEPYILNVELARSKLMQITLKCEDWFLFEETDDFADLASQARQFFVEALQNINEPDKASMLADECLKVALLFSEKLAARQAERVFVARCKNRSVGRHSLGCQIDSDLLSEEKYTKWLFEMFGYVTIPMSWRQIEPAKDEYNFTQVDRCIELLGNKRLAICGGPLLCFSKEHLPDWLLEKNWEFEKIREAAYEYVSRVVTRYTRYVHAWRVISGMNSHNHFGFNFEQILEMTRAACLAARSPETKAIKMVEILLPWGEYYADDRDTIPPLVYVDMVLQSGISFDAFGLQLHFGKDEPGMHIRDLMQISARLDCFAPAGKPLHITGVAVPGAQGNEDQSGALAGIWHKKWDQNIQAEWIDQVYRIALGKPFINSVSYSYLADTDQNQILASGLLSKNFAPKKAFLAMAKLQKLILNRPDSSKTAKKVE